MHKNKEAKLKYPRKWDFTIIGRDKDKIQKAIKEIFRDKDYSCKFSKTSKNGKFNSYSASCEVQSEEERDEIYKKLSKHNDLDYIL